MKTEIALKIERILDKSGYLSESDVIHLLTLTRKYLEHLDGTENTKYLLLKFFCDWAMHIAIDRSDPAMQMIKDLNNALVRTKSLPNLNDTIDQATSVISFPLFREQLHDFICSLGVNDKLTQPEENWINFIAQYFKIVLDCPLVLPDKISKRIKPYFDIITSNPIKTEMFVIGLMLSYPNKMIKDARIAPLTKDLSLIIFTSNTTKIIIPLSKKGILENCLAK